MIVCRFSDLGRYAGVIRGLEEVFETVKKIDTTTPATYPLSCGKILVQEGTTLPREEARLEAHRQYLDIQYILEGQEFVGFAPTDTLTPDGPFNTEKDVGFYTGPSQRIPIQAGWCYVVFPEDAHAPRTHVDTPFHYRKLVIKLEV